MEHHGKKVIQTDFFPPPEKDEPEEIIIIDPSGLQPKKVEEIKYTANAIPDTYMIYPTGGYHPFYGVLNTFPRYQLPIWPYIKRIKWFGKNEHKRAEREGRIKSIISAKSTYVLITLQTKGYYMANRYTIKKKNGHHSQVKNRNKANYNMHKLVASAYIPNPENKPCVMHINDDPTNFLPENLKWGTYGENMKGVKKHLTTLEQKYLNFVNQGVIKG